MTNKEYCSLEMPHELDSLAAAKLINEKLKEGWVKTNRLKADWLTSKTFTYYFEREIKNEE